MQHMDEILAASDHIIEHVLDAIEWKRTHPADDLLSALIAAEDDGDRLSPDELLDQVILLYIAGHETTVNLIGNGTYALLRHRAQLERWRDDPRSTPTRSTSCCVTTARSSSRAASPRRSSRSAAAPSSAGVFVLTCLAAANRDPGEMGRRPRRSSTSPAPARRSTWRSARASTTASVRHSPGSRAGSPSAR